MNQEELDKKLQAHAQWLTDDSTGERLNLVGQNCAYLYFGRANLRGADLTKANLEGAKLDTRFICGSI